MEMVKAVINLKEGVIELEGPREFVEKYLELYRPNAGRWQAALSAKGEVKTKEQARKRVRVAKPKGAPSCLGRIRNLIDETYFKDPKTSTEVMNYLKEQKGAIYGSSPVTAALNQLIKKGMLRRSKEGKEPYKYFNP